MTDTAELDVGIVGVNSAYWPGAFTRAIADRSDANLVGFMRDESDDGEITANLGMSVEEFAQDYELSELPNLDAMADCADAVFICTRNTTMPDAIVGALDRGLHAFAAKPIAINPDGISRITRAVETSDSIFTGGQTGRNHAAIRQVRELVQSGRVGSIHTVRVMHQHFRYRDWARDTWYEDPTEGSACHWLGWYPIDVAVSLLGPIVELRADGSQLANKFDEQPDHLTAIVHHGSDRNSSLDVYCDVGADWEVDTLEVEVVGSDGIAQYRAPENFISVHEDGGRRRLEFSDDDALETDIEAWLDACRGEGEPALSATEALHVAAAGCAWQEALDNDDLWTAVDSAVLRED